MAPKTSPQDGRTARSDLPQHTKQLNESLDQIALDLARALKNRSVRELVKEQTGILLAGQNNVLYRRIADRQISDAKAAGGTTFEHVLARQRIGGSPTTKALHGAVEDVKADVTRIPKLDIGVPVHHEKWDPAKTTPLVAFHHRHEIDDTDLERVKAYDASGNVHWLDAQEPPSNPVVVVGRNERTTTDGEVLPGFREQGDPAKEICLDCGGGGGGGDGGGGGGSTDEDPISYGEDLKLDRVRVLKDHEVWLNGDPEIYVEVKSANDTRLHGSKMRRDGGGMFGDDTSWYNYDRYLFTWNSGLGSYAGFGWHERDNGSVSSYSAQYSGDYLNFGFKYTNSSDKMGFQAVQIGVDDETTFKLGDVNFEVEGS